MFPRRRGGRAAPGPTASPEQVAEHAVRDAERFVRQAWESELLRLQDHMKLAACAAFASCDIAYARLAAARRDDDPEKIDQACAALEVALKAARESSAERDQVVEKVRAELGVQDRAARQHTAPPPMRQREQDGPETTAQPPASPDPALREAHSTPPAGRSRRRLRRWFSRLTVFRRIGPHHG